jgi:hypothetical protein
MPGFWESSKAKYGVAVAGKFCCFFCFHVSLQWAVPGLQLKVANCQLKTANYVYLCLASKFLAMRSKFKPFSRNSTNR